MEHTNIVIGISEALIIVVSILGAALWLRVAIATLKTTVCFLQKQIEEMKQDIKGLRGKILMNNDHE